MRNVLVGAGVVGATGARARSVPVAQPLGGAASIDPATAIRDALSSLPKTGGAVLQIPPGVYQFAQTDGVAVEVDGFTDLTVVATGVQAMFQGTTQPIVISNCQNLVLKDLSVDWTRPPFSQGQVIAVGSGNLSVDVQIDPEFPVTGSEPISAFGTYDRSTGLMSLNGLDVYGSVKSVTLVRSQVLRIQFTRTLPIQTGDTLVLRHEINWPHAIQIYNCGNVQLSGVQVHAAPGMAIVGSQCDQVTLQGVEVVPTPSTNRLMSTNTDAVHLTDCSGAIEITGCTLKGMGDDGINVLSSYLRVTKVVDSRTVQVTNHDGTAYTAGSDLVPAGDSIALSAAGTLDQFGTDTVASAAPGNTETIRFAQNLPSGLGVGDLLLDATVQSQLHVANCQFPGNRARGILAHSNALVEGCYFGNQTMSAVQLNPDALWLEGGPISGVTLQNNVFEGTGRQWAGQGAISIDAMVTSDGQNETSATGIVDHGVQVENNTFRNCYGPAVAANAIGGLVIGKNTMQGMPAQAVVLQNVQDVQVDTNTCAPSATVQVSAASSRQVELTGNKGLSLQSGGS